ncbi:MAG TPA: CPBP family intramembrane glutamic endopeptidase [Acidimicrobiia bacterium]
MGTPAPPAAVRWGLPDALVAWVVGIVAAVIAAVPFIDPNGKIPDDREVVATLVLLVVQNAAIVASILAISRSKGQGSLRRDFGLAFDPHDSVWVLAGVGLAVAAGILVLPITELAGLTDSSQDVVQTFEHSAGVLEKVGVAAGVVLVAPLAEELLFRGVLLRSLLRRVSPVAAVSTAALVFAVVHVLGDLGTGYYVPAFLLLGLVSGWRAVVTGRIGQSVCLHAGFNLVAAIQILT